MGKLTSMPARQYRSQTVSGGGDAVLETPWPLSPDELEEFENWVSICLKTIRRVSEKSWKPEIHPLAADRFVDKSVRLTEVLA